MHKIYYLHISSFNIPHYFSSGSIAPSIYYENRRDDLQTSQSNFLILSKKKWNQNMDCSIECALTNEIELEQINQDYFRCDTILPISRIIKVYYVDKDLMDNIIWATNETTAFIPEHIMQREFERGDDIASDVNIPNISIDGNTHTTSKRLFDNYNRILGAFAMSKLIRTNYFDNRLSYSHTFIELLLAINSLVELGSNDSTFDVNKFNGLFVNNEKSIWKELKLILDKNVTNDFVKNYASKQGIIVKEEFNIISLNTIEKGSVLYYLIILSTYGEGRPKSLDDFMTDIESNQINNSLLVNSVIILGLYVGYYNLRNKYYFKHINIATKFEFNTQLDYIITESIYNFILNPGSIGNKITLNELSTPIPQINKIDGINIKGFFLFGTNIITNSTFDFMSEPYKLNLTYKHGDAKMNKSVQEFFQSLSRIKGVTSDKLVVIQNLTQKAISGILENIMSEISNDYSQVKFQIKPDRSEKYNSYTFESLIELAIKLGIKGAEKTKNTKLGRKKLVDKILSVTAVQTKFI